MDLLHLVDRFEELVATAQKMPIGSRVIMDRRKLLDIVDQMRVVIPQEVREARDIVERRDELKRAAEEDARMIVARAEEQAVRLIDEHAVTIAAREHAESVAAEAQARLAERIGEANEDIQQRLTESRRLANEQMTEADSYSTELLQRLETQLEAFVRSVRVGLSQLEPARPEATAEPAAQDAIATPEQAEQPDAVAAAEASTQPPAPAVPLASIVGVESAAVVETPPATEPVSIHASGSAVRGVTDELENLLVRTPSNGGAVRFDEDAVVIDDFAQPRLDDEGGRKS